MRVLTQSFLALALVSICWACGETTAADAGGGGGAGGERVPSSALRTTYYVIRHTERDPGENPPINEEGMARAERLADALEEAGIDEIATTSFIRGQQSGQPLSDRTGAPITVAPFDKANSTWPEFATQVAAWQREREVAGKTYVMIGHSGGYNTTLLEALGAPPVDTMAERYQDMVILIREPDGVVRLSILQYGGESSLDP